MKKIRLRIFQLLCLAAALTLSADVWMQVIQSKSLCMTESCQAVGGYVRFGEIVLVLAGAIFYWLLWLLSFFAGRYERGWLWQGVTLFLLGALAFDGALLGFQFVSLQENCLLCIGVGLTLFLTAAILAWNREKRYIFLLACAVWLGGFAANGILNPRPETVRLQELDVITRNPDAERKWPQFYLFFGLHCPHCSELLANLAVNNRDPFTWHLIPMNKKQEDLSRVAGILDSEGLDKNTFLAVLRFESMDNKDLKQKKPPEEVVQDIGRAQSFFTNRGFRGVPLLIVQEKAGKRVILEGRGTIMKYLQKKKLVVQKVDLSQFLKKRGKQGKEKNGGN